MLAFPATWTIEGGGRDLRPAGDPGHQPVRIVALFYTGVFLPDYFNESHIFVWQSVVILAGVALWVVWARWASAPDESARREARLTRPARLPPPTPGGSGGGTACSGCGLRPALDGAVCSFAQLLIRAYEYPRVTRLVPVEHRAEVRRADFRTDSAVPTVALTEIHFNTIVLLALYLAVQRPWSRRQLERLLMGWSVLYLSQALNLVFHVKFLYASGLGDWSLHHYSAVARNIYGFLQYFTDLPGRFAFPFLIWLGFNWDLVMTIVGTPSPTAPDRAAGTRLARRR